MVEIDFNELKNYRTITIPLHCGDEKGKVYLFRNKYNKKINKSLMERYTRSLHKLIENMPQKELSLRESIENLVKSGLTGEVFFQISEHFDYIGYEKVLENRTGKKMVARRIA